MISYTITTIPVERLVGQHESCRWRPKPTTVQLHPSGRFAYFQHNAHQNRDAAIVHVASGVQLTCRAVPRKRAEGWIDHLLTLDTDDVETLRAALLAHIDAERPAP